MKTKCVIYARVSIDLQSPESQIEDLKRWALLNNLEIEKIFSETISGFKQGVTHIELENLKDFIKNTDIKQILTYELSRIGRNTLQTLKEIDYFSKEKVNIFCKKENINTLSEDATTKLLLSVLSSVAELERDSIIKRTSRGLKESALSGKRTGYQTLPYGYKADDNSMLVIDEEEAKVIELVFKLACGGTAQRSIAQHLNSLDIPTRWTKLGRRNKNKLNQDVPIVWKPNAIGILLKNTLYYGERKYKDLSFKAPAIIDKDIFDKAQSMMIKKVGYMLKETKYQYLLKGKIQCGICGRNYGCHTEHRYNREESFYSCNGAKDLQIRCKNGQFTGRVLDDGVFDLMLSHKDFWLNMRKDTLDKFNIEEIQSQIEYYIKELKALESKREKSIEAFTDSLINKPKLQELINKINLNKGEFEFKVNQLNKKINEFNRLQNNTNTDEVIGDWLQDDSYNNRRTFIEKYLNKVVIYKMNKDDIKEDNYKWSSIDKGEHLKNFKFTGRDSVVMVQIFAFDSLVPLKGYISNDTKASTMIK